MRPENRKRLAGVVARSPATIYMTAIVPGKRRSSRGRSLLAGLVVLAVLLVVAWWFAFGALSPCEAMRSQARRIGADKAGFLGRVAAGALTDLRTGDFTPFQCAVAAVKLKVYGVDALEDLVVNGRHPER